MSTFLLRNMFKDKKLVFPVIHATAGQQVMRNVARAKKAGAHGAFLINHSDGGLSATKLFGLYRLARHEFPSFWLGINCLDLQTVTAYALLGAEAQGVWVDNVLVSPQEKREIQEVINFQRAFKARGLYFGGTAFKYQEPVKDLGEAARQGLAVADIVVTSGDWTGQPPTIEKVRTMKEALDGVAYLGIASGMTPENVGEFLPWADCFLVATGVSDSFTELCEHKLRAFVEQVKKGA